MSFIAIQFFAVPFPWIVAGAALLGWVAASRYPAQFSAGGGHGAAAGEHAPAIIDDHTPTPEHARFSRTHLALVVGAGLVLWLVPMGLLWQAAGWGSPLTQMGWFFTKAALLTFGGAYAVLPYVVQGAVDQHQWLGAAQMMDGLALGETTPGPLIMIVAFVGFLGGWAKAVLGPDALLAGAALGATVATWFTFLPSFVFILAGGPLVESTHGKLGFTAPLTAITAAVVGVVASLAILFIAASAHSAGTAGAFGFKIDMAAVLLMAGAAVALFRFKVGVIPLIAGCGLAGLALRATGLA